MTLPENKDQHNPLHNPVLVLAVPAEAGHSFFNPAKLQSVASGVNRAASLQGAGSQGTKYVTRSQVLLVASLESLSLHHHISRLTQDMP